MPEFERLIAWENLAWAARAARRHKPRSAAIARFEADREANLTRLRAELADETWRPGDPRVFSVYDPKPRDVACHMA